MQQKPDSSLSNKARNISSRWPGREQQIRQLVGLIGEGASATPNILVYGPASTGKTSIVRNVFAELNVAYVYASCAEFSKPRQLLQTIAVQLKGKKRARAEGFAGDVRSEHVADFLAELPKTAKASAAKHILIDHAHRLTDQDTLAILLKLGELTGVRLSVLLISRLAWGSGPFETDTLKARRPIQVSFSAYEPATLAQILAVNPSPDVREHGLEIFKTFLRAEILPVFTRCTRRLEDVQALVNTLFPIYLRPIKDGSIEPGSSSKLHSVFQPALLAAKAAFDSGPGWQGTLESLAAGLKREARQPISELDFELPYFSKFILLAAYICSRNKPIMDKRLFDPMSRAGKRHGQMAHDKQVEASREVAMKGPHSFPLARMLAVFWHLLQSEGDVAVHTALQAGDVYMQIASLVSLRLLSKVSADELDEVKYRCNIREPLAVSISKNLSLNLSESIPNVVGWMTWGISSALFSSHLSRPLKRSKQTLYLDGKGGQGINTATQDTLRKLQQPMVASGEDFVVGRTVGCQT